MFILGAQYDKHNGPDAVRQHKIGFTVDESQQEGLYDWLKTVKKGTQVLLMIFNTETEEEEIKDLVTENPQQTKERLFRRMHALINQIADSKKLESDEVKKTLKEFLINKKYIVKSTKELTIEGLAAAIYYLQNEY